MDFEVVVLGASGTYPLPGSACSGYLIRRGSQSVWIDAGTGTFANLQQHTDFRDLDAVVLSHMHPDHVLDIYPFYHALRFAPTDPRGLPVYSPSGAEELLLKFMEINPEPAFGDFAGYLQFEKVRHCDEITIAGFDFRFAEAIHPVETYAMRIQAGGKVLTYSADSGPSDDVMKAAKDADVFIVEATLQESNPALVEIHMTAEEAGIMAAEANCGRVVLTHLWPGLDPEVSISQAAKHYDGEILAATDHLKITV